MARKKREEESDNHERWLVSYADFITLLFAFFVVMYAISSVNENKYRELTQSIGSAFGVKVVPTVINENPPVSIVPPAITRPLRKKATTNTEIRKEREKMTGIGRDLMKVLSPLINEGKVKVIQSARGVNVEINASVLFAPAEARLSRQSEEVLRAVAQILKDEPNDIQVEGFTDNMPISSAQYPSNWELSSARASSVVRLFVDQGIAGERMVAIGRSANSPIDDNATSDGRSRNRRVALTVLSNIPEAVTEVPVSVSENNTAGH
ncbi:flagellar motor protein MotD [Oxalobacter vibrioformis]|uniref:Flagellar motor protein MotD n=1 Tax=Oxalobacter vibrioformis TaxID=933080 RepID=A0A9E9LY21_9BURK|nr:flagellar motor protein MotD [Oxalobacter vibrioformis]WAW09519.1 flagellar motor protein MotD [Oxalobacter vibrioformis]